ncbi:MAG: GNAT family N-acetyltransferase, partial [Microbacterium sp.]
MTGWRIRDYHADDVDGILRLWEQMLAVNAEPVYGLSDVLASCAKDHAVVAVIGDEVVGAAIGRAAHAQGWVVFLATAAHVRGTGIGSSMLAALEARMAAVGISKLSALMPAAETRVGA